METDLEFYLDLLNSERCLKKPKEAGIVLDKISKCFSQEKSQFTIGLFIGLLLREDKGLFSFIGRASVEFETVSGVSSAFKLLDYLVTNFNKPVEPYFPTLYQKCLSLLNSKFAKIKDVALKLVKNMIVTDSKCSLEIPKLVSAFEKQLKDGCKIPGTALHQMYSLLGYLFEKHPESIKNQDYFLGKMLDTLKLHNTDTKNFSVSTVKGAFEGINGYLTNYPAPEERVLKRIYEHIKSWSKFREDKKVASREGLKILQSHWLHFSKFMYDDKEFWEVNLEVWIKQKKEDRELAFKFFGAFYSVIALFVKQNSNDLEIVSYLKGFIDTLESDANSFEKKAALLGIKLFVLTGSLKGESLYKTYDIVVNFIKEQENRKYFPCLCVAVKCLTAFLLKFPNECYYMEQLAFLQKLLVKLIDKYTDYESEYQSDVLITLEKCFYMLGLGNLENMENHIEKIVYQGLIRTCSSMTVTEVELLEETGQTSHFKCCKSYISLWKYLLTLAETSNLPVGGSFSVKKKVATKVFDAFVDSFLKITSKLNYRIDPKGEAENPSDLYVFINIVELYEELMLVIDPFNLQKWLTEIFRIVIHLSRLNPLVSGFYKITASALKIANRIQFFDEATAQKQNCFKLVRNFLEDTVGRFDQFKGQLQVDCLKVLLAAPVNIIESFVEKTIPALEVITQLARCSAPLLEHLIETLERWDFSLPSETSSVIMEKILPFFDVFFQSAYFRGSNFADSGRSGKMNENNVIFNDSEFLTLQKKLLTFLGNLEIRKGLNLIRLPDVEQKSNIRDRRLVYSFPYGNGSVELNVEEMILRIVHLAESHGNRKIRITACELLYSMVMVILGNVNQLRGGYTYLFRKVSRTCLLLGCDSDGLVCQIFEPLMYQIMHYFSGKQALHFPETEDLIAILMEYVTSPYNPAVREFSADLLREFTEWSIKQLSPEELRVTPESVKRILKKIYSLALHPSYNKRLGAAVLFNKIYVVLREESFILKAYWFELFYYFMESLRMCDGPEDVTEIVKAIQHVKRPLVEKFEEFNEDSSDRVVPPEFKGGRLCHLVKWTLERACDANATARNTAMSLVESLAPLVVNCDSEMSFANKQLKNFFQLKGNTFESNFDEENFITWLKYQVAGFEYSTWLLEQNVLKIDEVFQPTLKSLIKRFITVILSHQKSTTAIDSLKQQGLLSFLKLLYVLKEKSYSFPSEHWDLLKMTVFKPSHFGYDLYQTSSTEPLVSVVTKLIKYFSSHSTTYDWNNFYKDLESVITAPVFGQITRNQYVSIENLEFLFALRVVEKSGIWNNFMEKVFFSMSNDIFIVPLLKSLFFQKGQTMCAVYLDPICKSYFEELLKIMLKVSTDVKCLMYYLENEEEVREEDTGKLVKKGKFLLLHFKNTIFKFFEMKHRLLLNWVLTQGSINGLKLLTQVLENLSAGSELALEVLTRWEDFENINISDASQKNRILLHLAVCSARVVGTPGCLKTSPIADKMYGILANSKFEEMDFSEIEAVFSLLPFVSVLGEGIDENSKLNDCLSRIQVDPDHFKKSRNVYKLSHAHFALNELLKSLKTTGSLVVFKFILSRTAWFHTVCKKEDVDAALEVFGDNRFSNSHTISALELAYKYCFQQEKSDFLPSVVYKWFLEPLMKVASNLSVYHFVKENMENLCNIITTYWGDDKNAIGIVVDISKKISAAGVFQIFVTKLSSEELDMMPKEKRQMMVSMLRQVFFLLKKPYPPLHFKERYRKLMCEIFNMICYIVSARCSDQKFYKLFIFDERGGFLFEAIDRQAKYNLGMDFNEIPKRKKHMTVLRKSISKEQPGLLQVSIKYIRTNTLFTSSLQEDVTRFDLTFSPIRPMNSVPEEMPKNEEIELEMDSLNSHECMATLVATISKMVRDKITPLDDVNQIPCWLRFFLRVLTNPNFCDNLKLFVLKAMYNVQEFVRPFCEKIFYDLSDSVLKLFTDQPINYFFIDLIEMMVGWKHVPQEERSRSKLTKLVLLILSKSDSLRRDIVKNNVEILKTVIEVWKTALHLPKLSSVAFERLIESVGQDFKLAINSESVTYLNIHFCGVLLSNEIPAWEEGREKEFFDCVIKGFHNENKHSELFGEVCGLALSLVEKNSQNALREYETLVQDKINWLTNSWLQLLYGVYKHYPKMSSLFTFKIFSSAWDASDSLTVKKLEMLLSHLSRSETTEDVTFDKHASVFVLDMLNSPDVAVQEISLQIAEKILGKFDNEKLMIFTAEIVKLQRSVYSGVRKWVYEICKKLYTKNPGDYIKKQSKIILLRGVSDGVLELEESCLEFWRGTLNITSPHLTLLQILKEMYASEAEDIFLSNTARMLLHFACVDYPSKKIIFPHPIIHSCKFRKKNLVLGIRHSFLLSLVSSRRTKTNQSLEQIATVSHQNLPYLRPITSSLAFQPTVRDVSMQTHSDVNMQCQDSSLPANPLKRRFYKSEAKTLFYFSNLKKKEKHLKDEKEAKKKGETEVDILGEYRDGDYPDIQITHLQIVKLLQVLTRIDHQIAKSFLVSFYSGLIKTIKPDEKVGFLTEVSECIENILRTSVNFDPGVLGFVFQVMLNHSQHLDVDCQLISNAAVQSNCVPLGALIIEQIIVNKEGDSEGVAKKPKNFENLEEKRWLELARLYRSLGEFDVLSGIFLDKLNVAGNAREAIRCETGFDWQEASKQYEIVLRSDTGISQKEFYTESFLSCLAKLSDWFTLNKCIRGTVNNDLNDLWDNYNLLYWFVKSNMMISLGTDESQFQKVIEQFFKQSVKENILSTHFGEEMIVFDWISGNLQSASYRMDKLCLDFLADWSHLNQWSCNLRAAKLIGLQTLSELSFILTNLSEVNNSRLEQNIQVGLKQWEKNVPNSGDDLTIWDVKLGYRREFFKRLKNFDLRKTEVKCNLALAKAALAQNNLSMVKECLNRAREKIPENDFDLRAEHSICFNMGKMVLAKLRMKDEKVGLEVYLNVWNGISKQLSSEMETDTFNALVYSSNFTLGQLVSEILPYVKKRTPDVSPDVLKSLCLKLKSSEDNVADALQKKGLEYFELAKATLENADCVPETKSNTYLELCKFFLKFPESGTFEKLFKYLLKSMGFGNLEAIQLFGCLLNSSHLLPEKFSFEEIILESDRIPSWMFLMWINQMLASLSSKMFPFLNSILFRVTRDYPNSIRYALKLAEEFKTDPKTKACLFELNSLVKGDNLYEKFWTAMKYLAPPHFILKHHLENALEVASDPEPNYAEVKKIILYLQEIMFSSSNANYRGPVFKFWDKYEEQLEDLLTGLGDREVLKRKIKNLLSSIESEKLPSKRVLGILESYSPWLYNFHALKVDTPLELPGQYDGMRPPVKKYLVMMSSFKNSVVIFDSKCRPIRISILGNDAKEHKFLVKFGEDLRQDERIQQVFGHFNYRLKDRKTGFSVDTYKVIPLTFSLGMIEWVEDTASLYEIIENSLGNEADAIAKAQAAHLSFLSQGSPLAILGSASGTVAAHLYAYESITRTRAIAGFTTRVQEFPTNLLKKSFLDLSSSPEHFMHLRSNFATSHAVMCITYWLVGIGDRHLQNILVSTKTGRVLGIDFGYAFGFATQFLTPPELLPFRLTSQILSLMHPLGESGWIKQSMVHCLRIFRKESFRLRSVLEVFAQEPVIDWLKQVRKKSNYKSENQGTWYPREKIGLVEKKLNGANPVSAFEADLRAGHSESKYLEKYLEVLKGVEEDNFRARCAEDGLNEEEQVECLIDLATDFHVLAKTYVGWNSWL